MTPKERCRVIDLGVAGLLHGTDSDGYAIVVVLSVSVARAGTSATLIGGSFSAA